MGENISVIYHHISTSWQLSIICFLFAIRLTLASHRILNIGRHQQIPTWYIDELCCLFKFDWSGIPRQWVHHSRRSAAAVGAERCRNGSRTNRAPDQRNLWLQGQKGQRYQMCGNAKSKSDDPTVTHSCLLISQIDFDIMVTKQRLV